MADQSPEDLRARLNDELSDAYDRFNVELSGVTFQWGYWTKRHRRILGPYGVNQVGQIYRGMLAVFFVAGVVLSVVNQVTRELGVWPRHRFPLCIWRLDVPGLGSIESRRNQTVQRTTWWPP
jgi:hypothetical protein